jgi:hypothetical protein
MIDGGRPYRGAVRGLCGRTLQCRLVALEATSMSRKAAKHLEPHQFKPGVSGNVAGRPKGSRNRLQNDFIAALAEDFAEHGPGVIRVCRVERPTEYLKIIAGVLPKELDIHATAAVQEMSDEQLEAVKQYAMRQILQQSAINAVPLDLKVIANGSKVD